MYKIITLDIETIPGQAPFVRDYYAKSIGKETAEALENVKAPGNYKDPDKIADYIEDAKRKLIEGEENAINEAVNKTGLDGAFGQVVCIGFDAADDGKPTTIYGLDEAFVLNQFNTALDAAVKPSDLFSTTIVGHNVSSFDLRFLVQRYIVNGIRPHQLIRLASEAKPWEKERVYDTMIQFAGVGNRISLDKLCTALGMPGKGDITGADVWPLVQAGKLDEVAKYCESDVIKTRDVFKRMTFSKE